MYIRCEASKREPVQPSQIFALVSQAALPGWLMPFHILLHGH